MKKEQFLEMFKECVQSGDIQIEIETEKDSYYGDTQILTVNVCGEEIYKSVG
jgi:hypothetical protein